MSRRWHSALLMVTGSTCSYRSAFATAERSFNASLIICSVTFSGAGLSSTLMTSSSTPGQQLVDKAFYVLRWRFSLSRIFRHPDPVKLFVMEVDTFKEGGKALLSQSGSDQKLHLLASSPGSSPPSLNVVIESETGNLWSLRGRWRNGGTS